MQDTPTHEQRLANLEVEVLYTNTRVMAALDDIKSTLQRQDNRLGKIETQLEILTKDVKQLKSDVDELQLGQADIKKIVTTMQMAQLEKLQP